MLFFSPKNSTFFKSALGLAAALFITFGLARPSEAADFTGFYAGPEVGFIHSRDDAAGGLNGVYFGGFAGARTGIVHGLIAGLEGYLAGSNQNTTFLGNPFDIGRIYGLDGVIGVPVGKKTLLFGTLGYSNIKLGTPRDGIRIGAGVEVEVTRHASARFKINYSDFNGLSSISTNVGFVYKF